MRKVIEQIVHRMDSRLAQNRITRSVFVVLFAIVATVLIVHIHAQTPTTGFEAEDGSLTAGASVVSDPNASGGSAIKFNATQPGGTYTIPTSITADCSVNVTSDLNSWIATVPDGSTLQFTGGCYRIDQTLLLTNRNNLVIDGGGSTFEAVDPTGDSSTLQNPDATADHREQWHVQNGSNITFEDMTVKGANPNDAAGDNGYDSSLAFQHAFTFSGTQGVDVHNVTAEDTYGDAIYLTMTNPTWTSNVSITNNTLQDNGRNAISVVAARNVTISNNTINDVHYSAVDMEPNGPTWGAQNITISDNTISDIRLDTFSGEGIQGDVSDIQIINNHLVNENLVVAAKHQTPIRHDWVISGNVSDKPGGSPTPGTPIYIGGVDGVTITNNTQPFTASRNDYAVDLGYSSDATVSGNSFIGAAGAVYDDPNAPATSVTVCGNQLVTGGLFDQPNTCQ